VKYRIRQVRRPFGDHRIAPKESAGYEIPIKNGFQGGAIGRKIGDVSIDQSDEVRQLIRLAKSEDFGSGDVTSSLLSDRESRAIFRVLLKEKAVICGREAAPAILAEYDPAISCVWENGLEDGTRVDSVPAGVATIRGTIGSVLAAERVLLNFLQRLCGVATMTRRFVDAVAGTGAGIFDTRKTTPGWRVLEKYAVRCGGGHNHRMGLFDAVLIKDNHLAGVETSKLAGRVFEMLNALDPEKPRPQFVAVEAQSVGQVEELLKVVGIDVIVLDNMALEDLGRAVRLRDDLGLRGKVELEASGGIRLENVRRVAETGVERISVGAITHGATAVDLSLEPE
jgi:nicotinate-nucleotide pyrophosphorylase (carboxylating)